MNELRDMLQSVIEEALVPVNQRLDRMDQRFDGVDRRLDGMDQRFDGVDQRFDAVDQRFDAVDQRFDAVDQRFDGIDHRLENVEDKIDGISTDVKILKVGQQGITAQIHDRFAETQAQLNEINQTQHIFRSETDLNFRKFDRRIKLIETDLHDTMLKVESLN